MVGPGQRPLPGGKQRFPMRSLKRRYALDDELAQFPAKLIPGAAGAFFALLDQLVIKLQHLLPKGGQARRSTLGSAATNLYQRFPEGPIHDFHQRPCPHVGHLQAHGPARDGTVRANGG